MNSLSSALRAASAVIAAAPCPATGDAVRRLSAALPAGERARADRMPAPRRAEFVAGRALARSLLGAILECPAAKVPIAVSPAGRPLVRAPACTPPPGISLSHASGLVAVAVSRHADVGVDIEPAARSPAAVAWTCSAAERAWLSALPPTRRAEAFTRLWTRKEACVKALGTGIRCRLAALDCGPSPAGRWRDIAWREVPAAPGFAGAVAVRTPGDLIVHILPTSWSRS